MPDSGAAETLDRGLAALSLDSRGTLRDGLLAYLALLQRWNAKYNLTAIRDPVQMVIRHFFDCLAIAPWLPSGASRLVDVGSGAGFPGVPLALLNPAPALRPAGQQWQEDAVSVPGENCPRSG